MENTKSQLEVEVLDGIFQVLEFGRLRPVKMRIILNYVGVAATIRIGVPSDEELLGVAVEPAVGRGAAETDDRDEEDEAAEAVSYASVRDGTVPVLVFVLFKVFVECFELSKKRASQEFEVPSSSHNG